MDKWKKIKSFKVGNPDGSAENYTLSENDQTGDYRIENDFGNIVIDMERMSGYEFLKRVVEEIEGTMMGSHDGDCDMTWLDDLLSDDDDCDSGTYTDYTD